MVTQTGRKFWNGSSLNDILIDDEDAWLLDQYHWRLDKDGYAVRNTKVKGKSKNFKLHRSIMKVTDPSILVDHINGNKLDNRKDNLRLVTISQNNFNKGVQKRKSLQYKGVYPYRNKWLARIKYNGIDVSVGGFTTLEAAAEKYNELARKYHGEFAFINEVIYA